MNHFSPYHSRRIAFALRHETLQPIVDIPHPFLVDRHPDDVVTVRQAVEVDRALLDVEYHSPYRYPDRGSDIHSYLLTDHGQLATQPVVLQPPVLWGDQPAEVLRDGLVFEYIGRTEHLAVAVVGDVLERVRVHRPAEHFGGLVPGTAPVRLEGFRRGR